MFRDVPGFSGMFRNVPACSGMFRVPGFIDTQEIRAPLKMPAGEATLILLLVTSVKPSGSLVSFLIFRAS